MTATEYSAACCLIPVKSIGITVGGDEFTDAITQTTFDQSLGFELSPQTVNSRDSWTVCPARADFSATWIIPPPEIVGLQAVNNIKNKILSAIILVIILGWLTGLDLLEADLGIPLAPAPPKSLCCAWYSKW